MRKLLGLVTLLGASIVALGPVASAREVIVVRPHHYHHHHYRYRHHGRVIIEHR